MKQEILVQQFSNVSIELSYSKTSDKTVGGEIKYMNN